METEVFGEFEGIDTLRGPKEKQGFESTDARGRQMQCVVAILRAKAHLEVDNQGGAP